MSPIDRIIVDMYYAGIQRTRRVLVGARVCSGRIHDPGASTVADINAMYTDDDNLGSLQHTPTTWIGNEQVNRRVGGAQ